MNCVHRWGGHITEMEKYFEIRRETTGDCGHCAECMGSILKKEKINIVYEVNKLLTH